MASQSSVLLSGNGNHEAKYAGLTQGSHRMLPALVSIRKPACPTLVTCTNDLSAGSSDPPSLMGGNVAGVPQPLVGLDARRVRVDSVGVQQLALPSAGV